MKIPADKYKLGEVLDLKIIEINQKGRNIVLSEKRSYEDEKEDAETVTKKRKEEVPLEEGNIEAKEHETTVNEKKNDKKEE